MDFDNSFDTITPDVASNTITIGGTGSLQIPAGTSGQRPSSALSAGMIRWVSDIASGTAEVYTGATWKSFQYQSTNLDNLSALSTDGFISRNGTTFATRSLTQPAAGLTITNADGTAGNPTFALANDLLAVEGLSTTGIAVRTGSDTWATRSLVQGTGITITNADGTSGNITVAESYAALPTAGGTMTGAINYAASTTVSAAATTDLGAANTNFVIVNGAATTITSLGTAASGVKKTVGFSTQQTIQHTNTVLVLPGGKNIVAEVNDTAEFISNGSGNWVCTMFTRANGYALVNPKSMTIESPSASEKIMWFFNPCAFLLHEIRAVIVGSSTPSVTFSVRYGTDISAAGTELITGGTAITSTTTGSTVTVFTNATIPADNYVWVTTTALSGTVTQLHITLR